MYLSEKRKTTGVGIFTGTVTIENDTAVLTDCEKRGVTLVTPGGYSWRPCESDKVIVMKNGEAVLGVENADETLPGEVKIFSSGGAQILLKNDGTVHITGDVTVDGRVIENGT